MDPDTTAQLSLVRAEIAALRADQARLHERHHLAKGTAHIPGARLVAKVFSSLEKEPAVQYKVHVWAMRVWLTLTSATFFVFFFANGFWGKVATFWIVLISYYANWATDFDGASSSLAAIHARAARQEAEAAEKAARAEAGRFTRA
jgi:hypothetical protein